MMAVNNVSLKRHKRKFIIDVDPIIIRLDQTGGQNLHTSYFDSN